jgi:SAM-dependent methyltransferase
MSVAYQGSELPLFAEARHWKRYVGDLLAPFIGERVLEVGAGLGANIPFLHHPRVREWLCLEPDSDMAAELKRRIAARELPASCRAVVGDTGALGLEAMFDTALYLDVLEHIEDDRAELARVARHLAPRGALIVLAPAHPFLFSPFDRAIGHYRRYTPDSLLAAAPQNLILRHCRLIDSVGFFASLANRVALHSAAPSAREIAIWDRLMVPLSRAIDRVAGFRFGKSVLAIWTAP